ncbi:hypothetical protein ACGFX2_37725 [Streptomyces goshikiensis]|uniref:hypothetical protein n=1 Tax=Streptomyces goshikiensis TaxID=1942 RepID=UPI00371B0CFC
MTTTRTRSSAHRRILTAATAAALTAAALVTGCSKDGKTADPTSAPPSPSSSPTLSADPQAAEKAKVLAAYTGFWAESVKAYAAGSDKDTQLVKYAAKKALDEALTDVTNLQKAGLAMQGAPGHRAEATSLHMSGEHPRATVTDCLDISTWRTVNRSTGKEEPSPSGQPMRYVAVAEVEQWSGQWMVVTMTPNGDRTC